MVSVSPDQLTPMRLTVIGGKRWPDNFTVIWRDLPIGRIMLAPGLPPHVPQWRWTCNFYGEPGCGSGSGGPKPRSTGGTPPTVSRSQATAPV